MSNFSAACGSEMVLMTHIPTYNFTFKWIMYNFSKLTKDWTEKSPEFSIEPQSNWHVEFEHRGDYVSLYICREHDTNFKMDCEVTISDCNTKVLYSETKSCNHPKRFCVINRSSTCMQDLRNAPKDQLLLTVSIKVEENVPTTTKAYNCSITPEMRLGQLEKLSREVKNIFDQSLKTDLTLVVQGGSVVCHKAILAGRSPVFAKMFQKGMTEEETSTVHIDDVSLSTIMALLSFMYSAEVAEYDFDTALDLYAAADKYEVLDLKDICGLIIASKVNIETAPKLLYLADTHQDSVLKDIIMKYIASNYKPTEKELTLKS